MTAGGPTRPRAHVLETLSRQHVERTLPPEWICRDVQGDYGLDMAVEIVSGERVTGREFSIQLKATDHVKTSGDQIVHHCAVTAALYFLDRPEPVMYVVYDARAEVAYWLWVQPYLRDLDAARPGWRDQKTVAIRVPIANRLAPDGAPAIAEHVRAWWARMLAAAAPPTPYLPPRPLPDFVGREDELRSLDAGLAPGSRTAITGVIGMGGIGKTELAKLAASRAAGRFRDGVLWADCATQDLAAIAGLWAAAYERQLPGDDPEAKAAAWRSLVAGKEALLIFDNVQAGQEIEPLFPAQSPSAVLITTRDGRHPALRGAGRLDLDHFTFDEALELARKVLGADVAEAQAGRARRLFELVGYLPLAAAVALHAARDSGWSLETLAGKLEAAGALRVLGDDKRLHRSLNATFDTAYRALSADLRKTFAALALFNAGPSLSTAALADTLAIDPDEAQARLSGLAGRSLLRSAGEGRWSLHPLLREFAAAQGPVEGDAALRFARHYARAARAAKELYKQGGEGVLGGLALFDLEWPHIRQGQAWAAARSAEDDHAAALASDYPDACAYCLELRLPPRGQIPWLEAGAAAARRLGDKGAEEAHLGNLGLAYWSLGDARRAIGYYEQVLAIQREIGDRRGEGADLGNLGSAYLELGDARGAIGYYEQALAIAREVGDRRGEGNRLGNLGIAYANLGDARGAIGYYEQALAIDREIGDRRGEGADLGNLGIAYQNLGEMQRAIGYYEQALAIAREIGDRRNEAIHLANLGIAHETLGDPARARELWTQALAIYEAIEDPRAATVRGWLEGLGPG